MSAVERVAAYWLTGSIEDLRDQHGAPFDAHTYSLMKHGHAPSLTVLGQRVGEALRAHRPDLFTCPEPVLLPVAYLAVKPSCYYLSEVVAQALNAARVPAGLPKARVIRIAKDAVTATDYAAATAAEREAEMARIGFTLDEPVTGAHVVLVDDVRVTGLAEKTALAALGQDAPASLTLAYIAVADAALAASPHVEAAINHATVRTVADMAEAMSAGEVVLTIRFLKRVLAAAPAERATLLAACPEPMLQAMLAGAAATGPAFTATYFDGLAVVAGEVRRRAA